jgi:hypothetical protein
MSDFVNSAALPVPLAIAVVELVTINDEIDVNVGEEARRPTLCSNEVNVCESIRIRHRAQVNR